MGNFCNVHKFEIIFSEIVFNIKSLFVMLNLPVFRFLRSKLETSNIFIFYMN